jgi:hypothetical protein
MIRSFPKKSRRVSEGKFWISADMRCIASEGAVQSRAAEVSARDIQNSSDDRSDILNISLLCELIAVNIQKFAYYANI